MTFGSSVAAVREPVLSAVRSTELSRLGARRLVIRTATAGVHERLRFWWLLQTQQAADFALTAAVQAPRPKSAVGWTTNARNYAIHPALVSSRYRKFSRTRDGATSGIRPHARWSSRRVRERSKMQGPTAADGPPTVQVDADRGLTGCATHDGDRAPFRPRIAGTPSRAPRALRQLSCCRGEETGP